MKLRKGYSFIEAIISISILSALIVISINAITSSAETENLNKDFLTAELLANEALELVLALRNNNQIKFGEENIDQCGYMIPQFTGNANECLDSNLKFRNNSSYLISLNPINGLISVFEASGSLFDDSNFNEDFRVYTYSNEGNSIFVNSLNSTGLNSTKFFRGVEVSDDGTIEVVVGFIRVGGIPTTLRETFSLN